MLCRYGSTEDEEGNGVTDGGKWGEGSFGSCSLLFDFVNHKGTWHLVLLIILCVGLQDWRVAAVTNALQESARDGHVSPR